MKNKNIIKTIAFTVFLTVAGMLSSCGDPNSPGVEYMPDMYRSPAIEPYVDYIFPDSQTTLKPVENTIPRGFKPYPFPNTMEGYEEAGAKLKIPFEVTPKILAKGGELFEMFCSPCHGPKGHGKGTIQNPVYGNVPSFADNAKTRRGGRSMTELAPGHIYHTMQYGLNAMGSYASQITEHERWEIISFVQTIQGKRNKDGVLIDSTNETNGAAKTDAK